VVVSRWFTPSTARSDPGVVERARLMLTSTDPGSYAAIADTLAAVDLTGSLGLIGAPTQVLCGAGDEAIPPEHGKRLARAIDSASLVLVPGAAHLLPAERPGAVAEALLELVGRAGAAP
jgi:pimeloyl-ACP methyl ester carboxylesterase